MGPQHDPHSDLDRNDHTDHQGDDRHTVIGQIFVENDSQDPDNPDTDDSHLLRLRIRLFLHRSVGARVDHVRIDRDHVPAERQEVSHPSYEEGAPAKGMGEIHLNQTGGNRVQIQVRVRGKGRKLNFSKMKNCRKSITKTPFLTIFSGSYFT